LTGDDFSPEATEIQQPTMITLRGKKNAGKHTRRVDLRRLSPVSDSSLTASAELFFGVDEP
jgi:hypothetical protein